MSNGHTAADAIDAPPSGEGCVSVLDYADGQAKAFRTGQQNAAAQEAVAIVKIIGGAAHDFCYLAAGLADGEYSLFAAPVAAAPVEPLKVFSEGPWVFRETGQEFSGTDLDEAAFAEYRRASTPAAPGIDLRNAILQLREDALHMKDPGDTVNAYDRVLRLIDASLKGGSDAPVEGEVLVTVSGYTGSGKSAVAGEIEILCKALGLHVEWVDSEEEKRLTHADWTSDLELYKPRVRVVERNIPRPPMQATSAEVEA